MSKFQKKTELKNPLILQIIIGLILALAVAGLSAIFIVQLFFSYTQSNPVTIQHNNIFLVILGLAGFIAVQLLMIYLAEHFKIQTATLQKILLIHSATVALGVVAAFFGPMNNWDAPGAANGNVSPQVYYPQNLGLTIVFQFLFKFFGRQAWFGLYFLNLGSLLSLFSLTPRLTYQLSQSRRAKRVSILLLFFALPYIFMVSYPYNDLISLAPVMGAVYLLLRYTTEQKRLSYLVSCGLLLFLAYALRTTVIIYVIALGLYLIFRMIQQRRLSQRSLLAFLPFLILAVAQFLYLLSVSVFFIPGYTTKYAQPSQTWEAMALATPASIHGVSYVGYKHQLAGMYNSYKPYSFAVYQKSHPHADLGAWMHDVAWIKAFDQRFIRQQLAYFRQHPAVGWGFFAQRLLSSWGDNSLGTEFEMRFALQQQAQMNQTFSWSDITTFDQIGHPTIPDYAKNRASMQGWLPVSMMRGRLAKVIKYGVEKPFLLLLSATTVIFVVLRWRRMTLEEVLLLLIFVGGFLFHEFVWETQPRYQLPYVILLVPFAAMVLGGFGKSEQIKNIAPKKVIE